ncbi:MAG TPA: YdgA family protein [Syntrophobacteraceae bacterium]|nr:YdgA family protein [Syntrophobacteraceae bacterium]
MKKTLYAILILCLALIAVYVGASYWLGTEARAQHDRLIAQINCLNNLEASTGSYQRSIFRSSALTAFTLTLPREAGSIRFNVISSIYHGPFVFLKNPHLKGGLQPVLAVIRTRLAPADDSADALKKLLETIPELQNSEALTILFIDGSAESYLDVLSFKKKFPDNAGGSFEAECGGFAAKSRFDARPAQITGSWSCPSLQIEGQNQFILRMKDLEADFNSHPGLKDINVGSAALSIGSIECSQKDKSPFGLISFRAKADSGVSGQTIGVALHLSFDRFDVEGIALGPFIMELEARKIDAGVVSRFHKLARDLQEKSAGAQRNEPAQKEMAKSAEALLFDLIAKSPEFEIKQLRLSTDKGDLRGRARLGFAGLMGNPAQSILLLLAGIDASAELSVSEPLGYFVAENLLHDPGQDPESTKMNAHNIVKDLVAAKYIASDDGAFKSSAVFKHGALTINGRKFDLSTLKPVGQ